MDPSAIGNSATIGAPAPLLHVDCVTLQYKTADHLVTAASQVEFRVYPADRFILLGPSGCGKSSLLKAVGGFIKPTAGRITLNGKEVHDPGPDRMMVFQEFDQLLPWMTVRGNIEFPLVATRKVSKREAADRARVYLEKVNLVEVADRHPHTLSGGMKQRVAIARAMAMEPDVLLMDEPFASLDAMTRRRMQDELLHLWEGTGFTMLFVTHSIEEAIVVGSRILVLTPHPGRVKAELNAHGHTHEHVGQKEFMDLQERIHTLLFRDGAATGEASNG